MPQRQPVRLFTEWLVVGIGLSLLLAVLGFTGALQRLDHLFYDVVAKVAPRAVPDDIVIVAIDEPSLQAVGAWPWPRRRHADAIDRIAAARPRAIIYDLLFTEPRREDPALAAAIGRAQTLIAPDDSPRDRNLAAVALPLQFAVPGGYGRAYDPLLPAVGNAADAGHARVQPDNDGVVRSLDLALDGTRRWGHVVTLAVGAPPLPGFVARPQSEPLRRVGERLIGYRGGPGQFRAVPMAALLAGEVPPEIFRNRIVMVGATAAGLGDQFATTGAGTAGVMPGVELQANFAADLLAGLDLRRAGPWPAVLLALATLWLAMLALLRLRPGTAALCGLGLAGLVLALVAALFRIDGLWIGPSAALAGLLLAPPIWAWRRLAAVNAWMLTELAELGAPARRRPGLLSDDPVTRTTRLLDATIDRVDNLRELADAAVRGLPDATLLVDRDGEIVTANTAAEALFGNVPTLADVDAMFNGLPSFGTKTLTDRQSPWRGEHRARNGSVRDIRFTPWAGKDGEALGWIVRFADITALRRAEQSREEALQLLTHDMRAPQATILALLDQHRSGSHGSAKSGLDPELADRLRHLATRTIALADGYLQLARADAGGYTLSEVDLAAIATEAVDELWPQSRSKGITLAGEGLDDEALLMGDYQLLLRAAVNLIGNAVKFAPKGSAVVVRVSNLGTQWELAVTDSGPGLTPALQARLFGRFNAGAEADGVGLGLAFVRAVAQGHAGSVMCESVPGEGATFRLKLPKGI
jgi:CHASE2 domain-containing sensor protein/signal transduction histidine kinase